MEMDFSMCDTRRAYLNNFIHEADFHFFIAKVTPPLKKSVFCWIFIDTPSSELEKVN
jgi:hypothetical protein